MDERPAERLELEQKTRSVPHIKEVILENFMSHEYSRIPLKPGLNVIMGPNGAGKSSILLGISVALGQTYTERGERLSDLIRRGKDVARVTVVFDNNVHNGKRPFRTINTDTVSIARYLKRNGDYWHYVNNKFMTKAEVEHLLRQVGINPNNMLIIMHQNMIEQFVTKSSVEKLQMVEDAVGASRLRERIVDAEAKLNMLLTEEMSLKKTLEEARATVEYWKEEYGKLVKLRKLENHRVELERELAWSQVIVLENDVKRVEDKIASLVLEIEDLNKEAGEHESKAEALRNKIREAVSQLRGMGPQTSEVLDDLEKRIEKLIDELIDEKVQEGVARFKIRLTESEMRKLKSQLSELKTKLASQMSEAESKGPRVETNRRPTEIQEDLKILEVQINSLGSVTPNAEEMYLLADAKYSEVEMKAKQLSENIEKAKEEIERRKEVWREFLRKLVTEVEPAYIQILRSVDANGKISLRNLEDIEKASLDLYVGFRGVEPVLLDSHTQSGGERIVATLAFLLALQKYVKSPFRAVDEFDVHLDPLNRDRMVKMLTATARADPHVQYIIITPGYINVGEDANVIIVQNVSGKSSVGVVER
ncbi:MAG: AAA family ATPase [Nitrososphaerota archaeon]|nr:AAA family ATPase [Aigarchaeota archaeon]MDW8076978.1 AAA family ATPase [Nitrososphaerota archaeon]